jgi:putative DNA primase/helicase
MKLTEELSQDQQENLLVETGKGKVMQLPTREQGKGPFFEGKAFVPRRLAEKIMSMYNLKFAGEILWLYVDGVYRPIGEQAVQVMAQELLGDETLSRRIQETVEYIQRATPTEMPVPDPEYINVLNGRLRWRTRALGPHTPQIFEVVQLPVRFDPEAVCPIFDGYMASTFNQDDIRRLVEEIMGWVTIPDTRFEKAIMLTGAGANGKSVLLDIIITLLGAQSVSNIDLQSLEESRFKAAELVGKLANIFADLDDRALTSSSMFKMLVSGDRLTVERKFKQPFEFSSYARLLFSANRLPGSRDRTYAFYRRWLIVPFEKTFEGIAADKDLRKKLATPGELSGIFNRALQGLHRLFENGEFTTPAAVREALEEYRRQNDSVMVFLEECTERFPTATVSRKEFYAS